MECMAAADWNILDVLKRQDGNWGEWKRLRRSLVLELDRFCHEQGLKPLITSTTTGQHATKSLHYSGEAIDVMFPQLALWQLPKKAFEVALHYNFSGLGLYNGWRLHHEVPPIGGMHFQMEGELPVLRKKLWVRTRDGDLAPTAEVLAKYFAKA